MVTQAHTMHHGGHASTAASYTHAWALQQVFCCMSPLQSLEADEINSNPGKFFLSFFLFTRLSISYIYLTDIY